MAESQIRISNSRVSKRGRIIYRTEAPTKTISESYEISIINIYEPPACIVVIIFKDKDAYCLIGSLRRF